MMYKLNIIYLYKNELLSYTFSKASTATSNFVTLMYPATCIKTNGYFELDFTTKNEGIVNFYLFLYRFFQIQKEKMLILAFVFQ